MILMKVHKFVNDTSGRSLVIEVRSNGQELFLHKVSPPLPPLLDYKLILFVLSDESLRPYSALVKRLLDLKTMPPVRRSANSPGKFAFGSRLIRAQQIRT
jgi:hypothetical protein